MLKFPCEWYHASIIFVDHHRVQSTTKKNTSNFDDVKTEKNILKRTSFHLLKANHFFQKNW